MRGIDTGALSPETGLRVERVSVFNLAALGTGNVFRLGVPSLKGIIPNSPANAVRRGRVIRCGFIAEAAASGASQTPITFYKVPGAGNGFPALVVGDLVPLQVTLNLATTVDLAANTPFELTEAQMAPDERESSNFRAPARTDTVSTTTTDLGASASAFDLFYSGSLLRRMDTGEGQIITGYVGATKIATHGAWTKTPTSVPVGTALIISHDNRIVRPNDIIKAVAGTVVGATQPAQVWFYVDVLELATYNANNFA